MRGLVVAVLSLWCLPVHAFEPEMVRIPGGTFMMGTSTNDLRTDPDTDPGEWPRHSVRIETFEVSKYEITWDQWDVCVRDKGCSTGPEKYGDGKHWWERRYKSPIEN